MGKIRRILSRAFLTHLWDWIQVEVTTRCNASCLYCPRTVYGRKWPQRDLPLRVFERLFADLPRCQHVHLQGWGEPFLHPELFAMVKMVKEAGCRVGTTTNGTLMDEELSRKVVEAGFDVVAFSLAGTGPLNDRIRKGAPARKVMDGIRNLGRARGNSPLPEIHIAYMLLTSSLEEIRGLPQLLRGAHVSQVVVSTLDFIPHSDLEKEMVQAEEEGILSLLEEVSSELESQGVQLHHWLGASRNIPWPCTENVLRAVVIGADGKVSPCVYTNIYADEAREWRGGREKSLERVSFGNLEEKRLMAIWNDPAYSAFRSSFSKRALERFCVDCPKLNETFKEKGTKRRTR